MKASRSALRLLVVDDSAVVRQAARLILERHDMRVAVAADPVIALEKMRREPPDVILLDLQMPRMDGLTFLRRIMRDQPVPVVICSGHAGAESAAGIHALDEGAVAIVNKPEVDVRAFLESAADELVEAIRGAAQARVSRRRQIEPRRGADAVVSSVRARVGHGHGRRLIALGASTGGTEALRLILESMPEEAPGIVVVQHMPEGFTAAFAARLNEACRIEVKEAADGDLVVPGRALIARGGRHLLVHAVPGGYAAEVANGPAVCRHRPSVDVLFRSVARAAGASAVAALLTGMGDDGAEGLLELRQAGAATFAQDEQSCVVFGMPREAIARGAVVEVVPLAKMAARLLHGTTRAAARGASLG